MKIIDKVKQMSVEELAEWLIDNDFQYICEYCEHDSGFEDYCGELCVKEVIKFLESESYEGNEYVRDF